MKFFLDTHLILRTSFEPERLTLAAAQLIANDDNELLFSVDSIWEVAIKHRKHPKTFTVAHAVLRASLLERGFIELQLDVPHVLATAGIPLFHREPFDRVLLAQALVENVALATVDAVLLRYDVPTRYVG